MEENRIEKQQQLPLVNFKWGIFQAINGNKEFLSHFEAIVKKHLPSTMKITFTRLFS